jgi:hypothetical protein
MARNTSNPIPQSASLGATSRCVRYLAEELALNGAVADRVLERETTNMGMLLAFAPFIAFAVVDRLISSTQGLIAGAAASVVLPLRDWIGRHSKPKILEIGTAILFGGLALHAILGGPTRSIVSVRLRVDAGLLLIVLTTLIVGKPFTLQYAREQVPQSLWDTPQFIRSNYVMTGVWCGAFLILVLADLILVYRPDLPPKIGIPATVLALMGAFKFTQWYPEKDTPSHQVNS